ncbi:glycoside hydrolase family 15 protein [Halorubrum sp. Hd13]|uniref:glycoside hydrolase family 15 protein n=1 Tax=Halorubrum sp. Hd13 TaxID=1480728 RepID=UPI000B98D112|nr:glycoside hydrolase family 15 protein [Halorubrum sp. Hd13]OYR46730.1 glycoside hydrolase family 15 [Halorubrum sp. Hd13]
MPVESNAPSVPSDKDAILSAPRDDGANVLLTANRYDDPQRDRHGAIIEETSAFRSDIELFYDLHTLAWNADEEHTLDARDDAVESDVSYASSEVPEITLENRFDEDGSTGTLTQRVVASVDTCGLLIETNAEFETVAERTFYTVADLGIHGHDHEDPNAVQEAFVTERDGAELVVATDGDRWVAIAQDRDGDREFDGRRIGHTGVAEGPDRSAWADIYERNHGFIDDTDRAEGNLDVGVGLYVGETDAASWLTGVGFGYGEEAAVEHALRLLDRGYESERESFAAAWEDWHETVSDGPTDDPDVNDLYERSLTAMKCAQDGCCGVIAGAFKPSDMTYKFIWPRDQVIITQALVAAGAEREARLALRWFDENQITGDVVDDRGIDRHGTWWQNYFVTGEAHWRALQLDQIGGPIYAHWLVWRETGDDDLLDEHYDMSRRAAEFLLSYDNGYGFPEKHQDPWEEIWGHSTEGTAAAIAGLRSMGELADAHGDEAFAEECRERAAVWADNFEKYCFKSTPYGDALVTADSPETPADPPADARPDAASFMAVWPWNVADAESDAVTATLDAAADEAWVAGDSPCLGRYPGDRYTPTGTVEDGGWPLCEAYADVARRLGGSGSDAVADHVFEDVHEWTTTAGLLPERVDGGGRVRWNSNLQWSQATYLLLVEHHVRDEAFGLAPDGGTD